MASGSKATRLACLPGSMEPTWVARPASFAGAAEVHWASCERVMFAADAVGPEDGERGGEGGDAAPGLVEAAGLLRRAA